MFVLVYGGVAWCVFVDFRSKCTKEWEDFTDICDGARDNAYEYTLVVFSLNMTDVTVCT